MREGSGRVSVKVLGIEEVVEWGRADCHWGLDFGIIVLRSQRRGGVGR